MNAAPSSHDPQHDWPGCHGVAITSSHALRFARSHGEPLLRATVTVGTVDRAPGSPIWQLTSRSAGGLRFRQRLEEHPGNRLVLHADGERAIEVAPAARSLTVTPPYDEVQAQLLATFALPMLLAQERPGVLVLHGAAACRDGVAVLLCGPGGAGKSSALIGLVDAGWTALSEDVCVVDLTSPRPQVWPGPPWVRRAHGEPGPRGSTVAFRSTDKTGWTLGGAHAAGAAPLGLVVLLEPPGGALAERADLAPAERLPALAKHAVWLGRGEERGQALFEPVATLAARVDAARVRLPHDPKWVEQLVALLTATRRG